MEKNIVSANTERYVVYYFGNYETVDFLVVVGRRLSTFKRTHRKGTRPRRKSDTTITRRPDDSASASHPFPICFRAKLRVWCSSKRRDRTTKLAHTP